MASLFGGKAKGDYQNEENQKMTDGSVPEVATHTYEGTPSVDRNSENDTLGLKKTREALFGSRTQNETNPATRTFEEAASKLSQFTDDVPAQNSLPNAKNTIPFVRPTGVFVTEEGVINGKRYADRPEGLDQFGAEEAERDPAFADESKGGLYTDTAASLARLKDQPEGLDQFGGEGSEHERGEGRDNNRAVE